MLDLCLLCKNIFHHLVLKIFLQSEDFDNCHLPNFYSRLLCHLHHISIFLFGLITVSIMPFCVPIHRALFPLDSWLRNEQVLVSEIRMLCYSSIWMLLRNFLFLLFLQKIFLHTLRTNSVTFLLIFFLLCHFTEITIGCITSPVYVRSLGEVFQFIFLNCFWKIKLSNSKFLWCEFKKKKSKKSPT